MWQWRKTKRNVEKETTTRKKTEPKTIEKGRGKFSFTQSNTMKLNDFMVLPWYSLIWIILIGNSSQYGYIFFSFTLDTHLRTNSMPLHCTILYIFIRHNIVWVVYCWFVFIWDSLWLLLVLAFCFSPYCHYSSFYALRMIFYRDGHFLLYPSYVLSF